ncbi:hypothetical protein WEU38_13600 [Cyanobacterium aponinum AL20118]|uniref:Uncharacterized protein n=1 Tax=Cyanobacterium aponinum AL20115 TaxID=3090662 RepID=A0AAF0ZD60_9CHRO|nr:hypothetical protein [Cyanobacterium aponinum]PHV64051.1 hypothetical protein CSQ80_02040 [Cyanobacterium aponinum IPPAS B-1201]WPF87837.1 hypothetical protein SAY89_13670 [Cyanobacterium aponinum AL20115]
MKNSKQELLNLWLWVNKINKNNLEKGNTLIVAIGIGLVLIIATSLTLFNSSKDKTNVQAGEFSKKTMAVAELGVTRVHNFLAKNSKLAEYSLADWESQAGTMQLQGTFTNTSSTNSTCSSLTSGAGGTTVSTTVGKFKTDGDTVVENPSSYTDFRQGAFKVLDYQLADANLNPVSSVDANSVAVGQIYGHGILTIESQINPGANSASDLFTSTNSSQSNVQVTIPLRRATVSTPFPGVWISDQQIGSPSNSIINATLLVPDCDNMDLNIAPGNDVILSDMLFPQLPTPPADTDPKYYNLGDITSSTTLPRSTDQHIETQQITDNGVTYNVKVYKYKVNNISLNGGEKIKIVPGRKVVINLYGNIDIGGSQVIDNSCTTTTDYICDPVTKIVTYPSDLLNPSIFRRENLNIFGYGVNTGGPTSQEPHICLAGGAEVFGFVFAPDYAVGAAGTGAGNGFTGAVWARMFNPPSTCGSNTGQVVVVQDITDWDAIGLVPTNIPPQIGSITQWQRIGG